MKWKDWMGVFLLCVLVGLIKIVSNHPGWIQQSYAQGLYPWIALSQRFLLGWIPLSVGDLGYALLIHWVCWNLFRLLKDRKQWVQSRTYLLGKFKSLICYILLPYVLFNILWGMNYNKPSVVKQFKLHTDSITQEDMRILMQHLVYKLNRLEPIARQQQKEMKQPDAVFEEAVNAYHSLAKRNPTFQYKIPAVKASLFGGLGNYLGYAGYYNPFTGEAQVNTAILPVQLPFTTCHEIAHQLGYAKENEANIIGFLAAKNAKNNYFKYALYFDIYAYCRPYLRYMDSTALKQMDHQLNPSIQQEYKNAVKFYEQYNNPIEVVIDRLYGQFLKANQQPEGKMSYNRMVLWMVAYYKKYGIEAI